uniref:Uncharacterized protein n=1 Tax=Sphaerodactylus townsendi TaxID=933632 RepID=A0ACB8FUY7_9SAUR
MELMLALRTSQAFQNPQYSSSPSRFRDGNVPSGVFASCSACSVRCSTPRLLDTPVVLLMLSRAGAEARENPPPSLVAARRLVTSTPALLSYPRGRRSNAVTEGILGEALSTKPLCPGNVTGEIPAEAPSEAAAGRYAQTMPRCSTSVQRSRSQLQRPRNASM